MPQQRIVPERDEDGTPLTQPMEKPPRTHHSHFESEHGTYRKCHLCGGAKEDHMLYRQEDVWFISLQDRAKHILERHQDNRIECERASIILGFEALWNQYSEKKEGEIQPKIIRGLNPFKKEEQQPYEQQYAHQKDPPKMKRPLITKKKIGMVVLIIIILYGLYVMYLLSQGYSF
jgi:hypothetical protein